MPDDNELRSMVESVETSDAATLISKEPEVVYHYTTQQGLLGIMDNGEIWASDILYLNDAGEFHFFLKLLRSVIEEMQDYPDLSGLQETLDYQKVSACPETRAYMRLLSTLTCIKDYDKHICACSFSVHDDALSQWRGYGHGGAAYSSGFPLEVLRQHAEDYQFYLQQCHYNPILQREVAKAVVGALLSQLPDENEKAEEKAALEILLGLAPLMKDPSFSEEQEWRLFSRPAISSNKVNFRSGASMLVPYFCLPLKRDGVLIKVDKITVGPCPNPELSVSSVKAFLRSVGLGDIEVVRSKVPYRTW